MEAIKRNIPNFITCLNLVCGCIGIVLVFEGEPILGIYAMFSAAFFDFVDGLAARLLKVTSPIGKDLDSLADVVTFGVLPGMLVYQMIRLTFEREVYTGDGFPFGSTDALINFQTKQTLFSLVAFIIPVFSAIRLARFNNDPEQSYSFKGLPTPANGLIIACFFHWIVNQYDLDGTFAAQHQLTIRTFTSIKGKDVLADFLLSPYFWIGLSLIMSALLVSPIKLMAFKFKGFGWKQNQWKYILLILCLPLVIWLKFASAPIILILYILISQIHFRTQKHEIQS